MNFYRLRFLNTLLLFIIGIFIGYLFKKNIFGDLTSSYKPVYSSDKKDSSIIESSESYSSSTFYNTGDEKNPIDEDGEYILPVDSQDEKKEDIRDNQVADNNIEFFIKNPKDFIQKNILGKIQMIIAKKMDKGWRLNFVYTDESKQLNYIYIDDIDNISGESPDYKIGYFYLVKFYSSQGDLKKGNNLISVSPTGEKVPWASGVSAIEY